MTIKVFHSLMKMKSFLNYKKKNKNNKKKFLIFLNKTVLIFSLQIISLMRSKINLTKITKINNQIMTYYLINNNNKRRSLTLSRRVYLCFKISNNQKDSKLINLIV